MAFQTHVNGPAIIKYGLQGPGQVDPLVDIGITENGPLISIEFHDEPVMADNAGPSLPADLQAMGKSAKISFFLPIYDLTALTNAFLKNQSGPNEGELPTMGTLIFANGLGFRLVITSPIDNQPWRFFYTKVDSCTLRPGTKYNVYDVNLTAIPYVGVAQTTSGIKLYDHVAS